MPYRRLRITRALVTTSVGRRELLARAGDRVGPSLCAIASLYRKIVVRRTRVVAVVGSFGKTTTARAVIASLGLPHRHVGLNAVAWVALACLRIRPGQRYAVIEVGINGPGQMIKRARTVWPDIAVVTSVGSEHNRSLKNLEMTRNEKAEMVRILPSSGAAVLNGDDPNVRWMAGETRARVVTFGFGDANDVRATDLALDWPHGTRFTLHTPAGTRSVRVRLIGRPMVYAVLAAAAVGVVERLPLGDVVSRLEALEPTPGRLQPVPLPNGAVLLRDDFKAPEETIEAALEVLREIPARRRIVVLGDVEEPVGPQRRIYRRQANHIAQIAARAVFVSIGDNFSSRKAGAKAGGLSPDAILKARNIRKAVDLLSDLDAGDVVLVKGRHTQRLERVALALMGREVRCELVYCNARLTQCGGCPMLGQNWEGLWAAR